MQRPKIDMIELLPEMIYGAQYILCVMYDTCRLSFRIIGLLYDEKQDTAQRSMLENTYPEAEVTTTAEVNFISDRNENLGSVHIPTMCKYVLQVWWVLWDTVQQVIVGAIAPTLE